MASVNKWIGIGNLGNDPEVRYLPSGDAVTNISIACTDRYKDKATGEQKEITEWVRINFFGRLAEVVGEYCKKGNPIYVEGSLRTRKWTDKDGQEKYSTEIRADNMQLLGTRQQGSGRDDGYGETRQQSRQSQNGRQQDRGAPPQRSAPPQRQAPPQRGGSGFEDMDDDIPF